jgi:hypothetical protein
MGMRSPWKLIRDFASRHKASEARVPADEIVAITDPRAEGYRQDSTPRTEIEVALKSKSTADENEASGPQASAMADRPTRVTQSDSLLAEPAEEGVGEDQPLRAATVIEGESVADVPARGHEKQRAKAARARKKHKEPPVVTPDKTFLDEASELNLEIDDLRSQLSAKLLQQNAHLRRLLERYNDK